MHPESVLFQGDRPLPDMPAVDHYSGSEKLIRKAMSLQHRLGPVFDITCDCEDGAPAGEETAHAKMVAEMVMSAENRFGRIGVRVHDVTHPHWQADIDILIGAAASRIAFVTLPKPRSVADVCTQIQYLEKQREAAGVSNRLPVHALIETHGALRDAWHIAQLDLVESLDFGLMDFVSAHHGAIPGSAMRSPGQFDHPLVARAKCETAAAALGNAAVPTHNVTTELNDVEVIRGDAERARKEYGFLRMWSIHPNQIEPILDAMRPDFSEVEQAVEILCAAQDAQWGPTQHRGTLHDRASYRYYWTLLKRAHSTGVPLATPIKNRFFAQQAHA